MPFNIEADFVKPAAVALRSLRSVHAEAIIEVSRRAALARRARNGLSLIDDDGAGRLAIVEDASGRLRFAESADA